MVNSGAEINIGQNLPGHWLGDANKEHNLGSNTVAQLRSAMVEDYKLTVLLVAAQ